MKRPGIVGARDGASQRTLASGVLVIIAIAAPALASDDAPPPRPKGPMERFVAELRARVDAAIVARPPKLVPPKQLTVRWKLQKSGSLDLGAPLVALTGGDLDGDGKGELYAVTTRDVIAIGLVDKKLKELGRVAFEGQHAVPRPRDVVGSAITDANTMLASVSTWARSLRVSWRNKTLTTTSADSGFTLCPGEVAQLAPGRNYFGDATTGHYGVRCRTGLVEPDGHPIRVRAELSFENKLNVAVERCAAAGLGCVLQWQYQYAGVGVAFDIADIDRDGKPEAIFAGAGAPGDPDTLKIVSLGDDEKKQAKLKKVFTAGGIAGLAVADLDGDGMHEVIAGVRLVGAARVDFWRLE